jgi:hypothetical protein
MKEFQRSGRRAVFLAASIVKFSEMTCRPYEFREMLSERTKKASARH